MRTGHVAIVGKRRSKPILGTAKPCCDIAKDLHLRGPPRILQQARVVIFHLHRFLSYRFRSQASVPGGGFLYMVKITKDKNAPMRFNIGAVSK